MSGAAREVELAGRRVALTNEAKVFYPATGFTKGDVVAWYRAVAPALLPHLAGRPVTLARYPDGVDAPGWYQTHCPPGRPAWLRVAEVRGATGQTIRYALLDDAASLAWAANTGAIELHPLLRAAARPDSATAVVFDLDPAPPAGLLDAARVALRVAEALAARGLAAHAKTSGAKGIHVLAPLDGSDGFGAAKAFARAIAAELAAADPAVSDRLPRAGRAGRVLVDWRQNDGGRSLIAPWSLRAATEPLVSTPVRLEELAAAVAAGDERPLRFGPREALARLEADGDAFAPVLAGTPRLGGRAPVCADAGAHGPSPERVRGPVDDAASGRWSDGLRPRSPGKNS